MGTLKPRNRPVMRRESELERLNPGGLIALIAGTPGFPLWSSVVTPGPNAAQSLPVMLN